jgi:peptidoglycan/xylan/chitin deacetylase (PgdA/CDA1 family)
MRLLALLLLALTASTQALEPRRVAITIDDLPWVEYAQTDQTLVLERHRRLLAALASAHTQAIGFVNEDKLEVDGVVQPWRREMLADWLRAGLDLGNHTYGHVGLHTTPIADYEQAILRGERETRALLAARGRSPQWFRHPFLQAGQVDADRARLDAFLAAHGYRIAPVTVDNGDWIYARAYWLALNAGDRAQAQRLADAFVDYIDAKFAFYEDQSRRLFGREIAQVLLLHASALNADTLPRTLKRLRQRGYVFVDLPTALADPAYRHEDGYRGRAGISWMHRWAMAEHKPTVFYQGEPVVPPDVLQQAGVDGE